MSAASRPPILERVRSELTHLAQRHDLLAAPVEVLARPLTPEEAIGTPGRRDFPIVLGKERILEATFGDARGHAFTDSARELTGTVGEVLALPLDTNANRAIFVATLNAALRHLGEITQTVHCKDDDPETCGAQIAEQLSVEHPEGVVGLVGLNPAIADHLVRAFGADRVLISDLYAGNVGEQRFGVEVWDGATRTTELIERADVVLLTGTTLQNGTFDAIWAEIETRKKRGILFGVTGAGVCALTGLERLCPCSREG